MTHHHKVVTKKGLNVNHHQSHEIPNMRNETIIIPSTSTPSFGSYFIFDMREKGCMLHDLGIEFKVGQITGQTLDLVNYLPRYNPAIFWFTRIEIVQNSQVIDTIYPVQQFVHQQLFNDDPRRKLINHAEGAYDDTHQRFIKSTRYSSYYVSLSTYFNQGHIPLMYPKDDIQLRVYMDTLSNIIVPNSASTGVPTIVNGTVSANLLAKVSRLQTNHIQTIAKGHSRPNHYKFTETRFGTFAVTSSSLSTTIVLTPIVGTVS